MKRNDDLEAFLTSIQANLSRVKETMLRRLWESGKSFPKDWVKSSELLRITDQKYFDRRLRELRDECGVQIDTRQINGEHCWRLRSASLGIGHKRNYLTEIEKKNLFRSNDYTCSVCGKIFDIKSKGKGLQADHRIPLIRGGSAEKINWQPLCNECNVLKRGTCAGCQDDCRVCPWAFPEKTGRKILMRIDSEDIRRLNSIGFKTAPELEKLIKTALRNYLKSKI